ncbi:MAG: hypothetical protein Q8Q42_01430 [Nanoarchaeota archaeon]|nr:hypothetical protein [Nanoarchaeota archaeon]
MKNKLGKSLRWIFEYIAPPEYKENIYTLGNGSQVVLKHSVEMLHKGYDGFCAPINSYRGRLSLNLDEKIMFMSKYDSFSKLGSVSLRDTGEWEEFPIGKMEDEDAWRQRYTDLATAIYVIKSSSEKNWGEVYDKDLVGGEQ